MKFKPVTPVPGNYEGICTERKSSDIRNLLTRQTQFVSNTFCKPFSHTIKDTPIDSPVLNSNYIDILPNNEIDNNDAKRRKEHAVKIIVERLKYVQSLTNNKNISCQNNYTHKNETTKKLCSVEMDVQEENKVSKRYRESKKDLQSINMTALNIIDENISKAVSVAEQIKQEMDVEMRGKLQERREIREVYKKQNKDKHYIEKQALSFGKRTIHYMKTYMQSKFVDSILIRRIFWQLTNLMVSLARHVSRRSNIIRNIQQSIDYNTEFNNEEDDLNSEFEIMLSGAEMSRKFGKTPLEFTTRMDTVITEFEKKSGIEHTTERRSRSRSRSAVKDKLINDDFIFDKNTGKNTYRAFVTEEWSEYYDLGQPEVIKTLKSEKYIESKSMKKETIEKLVEEKVQTESPLTYIAIVQAHVFTNQDAIISDIQEQKHEKHTIIEASTNESTMQTKKQDVLYTELEHKVIRVNKEKPIEKVVVVESIEDITPIEEYKPFPEIEQVKTGITVQKTTEVLEPITEIEIDKKANNLNARQAFEPSSISIASIEPVVIQDEKDDSFIIPDIKPKTSVILLEPPLKSIAETTEIDILEPRVEIIDITQNTFSKPFPSIEAPAKQIAQVSQVEVSEPQSRSLELKIPIEGKYKELVQSPVQAVAVNMETFDDQSKIEFIDTPQTKTETSYIILEPSSKTVAKKSEVYIDETTVNFKDKQLDLQHVKQAIEPTLHLVEKLETNVNELTDNDHSKNIQTESFRKTFEQPIPKVLAQTINTSTDVANLSTLKRDVVLSESAKTNFEESFQTVAEKTETFVDELEIQPFQSNKIHTDMPHVIIETSTKTVAEKSTIMANEPKPVSLEIDTFTTKIPKVLIEDSLRFIAETTVSVPDGPKLESFDIPKLPEVECKIVFDKVEPTVVSQVLLTEPSQIPFHVPQVKIKALQPLIEEPLLTAPGVSMPSLEGPKVDILVISNTSEEHANLNLKTSDAACATEIALLEPQCGLLDIPEIKEHHLQSSMEEVQMAASHIQQNVVLETKDDVFLTPIKATSAFLKIDEQRALEGSLVISEDTIAKRSEFKMDVRHPKISVGHTKSVAESMQIKTAESEKPLSILSEAIGQVARRNVHSLASLAQTATICEEVDYKVDEDVKSKSHKKSTVAISEVKLSEPESSKSPSPISPVNDVYFFCVATPYAKHEPEAEQPSVELDYKSKTKKQYTQAEMSVAQSIGIVYQVSDSEEEEVIKIENEYEKRLYESEINIGTVQTECQMEHMKEQSSEYAMQKYKSEFSDESHAIDTESRIEMASKTQASSSLRQDVAEKYSQQSSCKRKTKSVKSKKDSSKSLQETESTLKTKSQEARVEMSQSCQIQDISESKMQSLEQNSQTIQQNIKVIEKDIESRHALLSEHDLTSKQLVSKQKNMTEAEAISNRERRITQLDGGLNENGQGLKSPPTEPATPLTDEYMFRLTAPLPSREGTPVPRDCTSSSSSESEEEFKRKLIPHIELSIEQRIFDPPLPTPPISPPVTSSDSSMTSSSRSKPLYSKPGLKGGGDTFDLTKEDILEIGRQSTLLASAIDKTIKRIEEYKSEAAIMEYATTEISGSETGAVNEFQSEDNKVEVLIDKMVETSRRFSGEAEGCEKSKEFVIPIVQECSLPQGAYEKPEFSTTYSSKEVKEERKMESTMLSQQLLHSVQSMVDPNASVDQRLAQMQAQIAELSKLPDLIHKTLDDVKVQYEQLNYQVQQSSIEKQSSQLAITEQQQLSEKAVETSQEQPSIEVTVSDVKETVEEVPVADTEIQNIIDKRRLEAESKTNDEIMKERLSQELRIAAERLSPKLGFEDRPYMGFSPLPQMPSGVPPMGVPPVLSLPMGVPPKPNVTEKSPMAGPAFADTAKPGKVWKKLDNYDDANLEQMLTETLAPQEEVIKGNAIGVNFMKYEKPPPALDHLQHSEVYKAIHEMDQMPLKKVEMLKPAVAASDYVERLRSVSPAPAKTLIEDCEV